MMHIFTVSKEIARPPQKAKVHKNLSSYFPRYMIIIMGVRLFYLVSDTFPMSQIIFMGVRLFFKVSDYFTKLSGAGVKVPKYNQLSRFVQ